LLGENSFSLSFSRFRPLFLLRFSRQFDFTAQTTKAENNSHRHAQVNDPAVHQQRGQIGGPPPPRAAAAATAGPCCRSGGSRRGLDRGDVHERVRHVDLSWLHGCEGDHTRGGSARRAAEETATMMMRGRRRRRERDRRSGSRGLRRRAAARRAAGGALPAGEGCSGGHDDAKREREGV